MQSQHPEKGTKKRKTTRRGNREGCIYQRTDGRWAATLSLGYDANGKRMRRTVYGPTKREVQDELGKLQHANNAGMLCKIERSLTVFDHINEWLTNVVKSRVSERTYFNYRGALEKHIKPRPIAGIRLQSLLPAHVQSLYKDLEDDKVGSHARLLVHFILRGSLKVAMRWGRVSRNVADAVDRPVIKSGRDSIALP